MGFTTFFSRGRYVETNELGPLWTFYGTKPQRGPHRLAYEAHWFREQDLDQQTVCPQTITRSLVRFQPKSREGTENPSSSEWMK